MSRYRIGRDLNHVPYPYDHHGKGYVNRAAEILMIYAHIKSGHGAARLTVTAFRTHFWVRKATKLALWAKRLCGHCLRMDAPVVTKVVTAPQAPLPAF